MESMTLEIAIVLLLILLNGFLSMSEMAIISARKTRLQQWAEQGDEGANAALTIANSPNDFLSTNQIGITLVGIFAGAFGGATIAEEISESLHLAPHWQPYADHISIAIVVGSITFLSLIFGELVPKRLALYAPEKVAKSIALPMQLISQWAKPVVAVLSGSTNLILRLLRMHEPNEPSITESELHLLVEQAAKSGLVEESEQEMVVEVLRLGDRKVTALMTPHTDVMWLDTKDTLDEILIKIDKMPYSTFPVANQELDAILGIIDARTILQAALSKSSFSLSELVSQPLYVPENTTGLQLLERFKAAKQQIAIVMDEYGGMQGVVTSEDIFQAIVGQLPVEGSGPRWQIIECEDGSFLLDGQMPIEEFLDLLNIAAHENGDYQTLAGFILFHLQRVPQVGEKFEWHDLKFEIVDLDRHRIDKVQVSKLTLKS
jgi:putative hemolysin